MLRFTTTRRGHRYTATCVTCEGARVWAVCRHEADGTILLDQARTLAHALRTIERESAAAA